MKVKVTDVVTMAWNDHRISLSNDDVKVEIICTNTIKSKNPLLKLKKGDEVELFGKEKKSVSV